MLNMLVRVVFFIIGKIGDIIFIPVMTVIDLLISGLNIDYDNIFTYLEMGFNYVPFALKCLLIPSQLLQIVIVVFTFYLTIVNGIRIYQFTLRIYNYFKT